MPIQPAILPNVERTAKKPPAIFQIKEVANIPADNMRLLVGEYFYARGIQIADSTDESGLMFETVAYETKGNGCQEHAYSKAPIVCKTKFYFKIDPINEVASILYGKYVQQCDVAHDQEQICAGSFGEQHLLSLASIIEGQ